MSMPQPKIYKPRYWHIIVLKIIFLILFIRNTWIIFSWTYSEHGWSYIFIMILHPIIFLIIIFYIVFESTMRKRQPVIKVYSDKVEFFYSKLNNQKVIFKKTDINKVVLHSRLIHKDIRLRLSDVKKYVNDRKFNKVPNELSFSILHYVLLNLLRIKVTFKELRSIEPKSQRSVLQKILKLNQKQIDAHFLLSGLYYSNIGHVYHDLSRALE